MSSPSKRAFDDCGQRTRTSFELSESGESKLIVDEVQYQIDCLRSQNATAQTKKKALLALVQVFSTSVGRGLRQRLFDKIQDIFVTLSQLLGKRSAWSKDLLHTGMMLIIMLSSDSDGSFDQTVMLPKRLLSAILQDYNQQSSRALCECNAAQSIDLTSQAGLSRSESTETGFHRKRKFTAPPVGSGSTKNGRNNTIGTLPKVTGSKFEEHGQTDFLTCLAGTFWCATCTARRDTESTRYCDVLQLIFLNRYLASKVTTLSSVHTDYFQNAHHAIQEEEGEGSNTKSSSAVDAALRSPEDPQSRSSKSFYQRQLDTLSKTQSALQDDTEDCGGDGRLSCYLSHLCSRLWQDTQLATEVLQDDSDDSLCGVKCGPLFGRMWLLLGILDAACFRSPHNQSYLASLTVDDGYQTAHRSDRPVLPFTILAHLLEALTPAVAASVGQQRHTPIIAKEATVGGSRSAGGGGRKLPAQWMKFHGLFPEIPVVLSHNSAAGEAMEVDLFADDAPTSKNPPSRDVSGSDAAETTGSAAVGVLELFTAAVKALTSLVANCDEAADMVRSCAPHLSNWATRVLAWCAAWRCGWAREGRTGKTAGALSPNETIYERFIFDSMLHLHSLLTHLHASGRGTAAGVVDMAEHSYLLASLPRLALRTTVVSLSDAYMKEHCPLIVQLLSHGAAGAIPKVSLPHLLAEVLYLETADFLQDLEETDEAINEALPLADTEGAGRVTSPASNKASTSRQQTPSATHRPNPTSSGAGNRTASKGSLKRTESSSLPIPVAELVVAAHAALLLHTLEGDTQVVRTVQTCRSERRLILGDGGVMNEDNRGARAVESLPRGDWWLCVRVLKAFLTLQGQTGIMLLDNIAPVVQALKYMQEDPASIERPSRLVALDPPPGDLQSAESDRSPREHLQPSAAAPALVTTAKKAASKSTCEAVPDWIDFGAVDDDGMVGVAAKGRKAASGSAVGPTEKISEGKWEWNGYDYVWVARSAADRLGVAERLRLEDGGQEDEEQDCRGDQGRLIDAPIVLEEEEETARRPAARLTHSTSNSSSLNELAPSSRKRTYGRASSTRSAEEGSSSEDYWGLSSSQESGCSMGVVAPVTSLFPVSSAAAPLRAPAAYAGTGLKKPRVASCDDQEPRMAKRDRGPARDQGSSAHRPPTRKEPEVPVADQNKSGWRTKRKFVSAA